jgi:hypothetical protein
MANDGNNDERMKRQRTSSASEDEGGEDALEAEREEDDRTFMTRNFKLINKQLNTIQTVNKQIQTVNKQIQTDINLIKGAIMPITPIIHSPLKRLQIVSPTPPVNCPVSSTWTMVDLIGSSVGGGSDSQRCLLGARHCALPIFFTDRLGLTATHPFFVELNEDILNRDVQSVGILNPGRGNLQLQGDTRSEYVLTDTFPADDIVYVIVKNTNAAENVVAIPKIPDPELAGLRDGYYSDMCLIGHSLETAVASVHGIWIKVEVEVDGTGVMKFVMSRCERGNSGTILHLAQLGCSVPPAAAGLLFGLDEHFVAAADTQMARRGVAPICPKRNIFSDCKVIKKGSLETPEGHTFEAIVGYDKEAQQFKTAFVKMRWANESFDVIELSYDNITKIGVLCESETQILYSAAAGMSHSPDVFALG